MTDYPFGGTAVVTGAGSGIGRSLAHGLTARGLGVALVDVHQDRLDAVEAELRSNRTRISTHRLDVTDREAAADLPEAVAARHDGPVSMLFNNAGVAMAGRFEQVPEADFDWVLDVNLHAPIQLTRAFLPHLKAAPKGRIVNISSIFGIIAPAGQAAYSASKFGLRGFSEALRHELAGTPLGVTVVHPGGVNTRIAKDARVDAALAAGLTLEEIEAAKARAQKNLVMPPERAAAQILDAAARGKGRLLIGSDAKMAAAAQTLFPVRYYDVLRRKLAAADEGKAR